MCLPTYLLACLHVPHLHNKAMLQFHCRICHSYSNYEIWNLTTLKNIYFWYKTFLANFGDIIFIFLAFSRATLHEQKKQKSEKWMSSKSPGARWNRTIAFYSDTAIKNFTHRGFRLMATPPHWETGDHHNYIDTPFFLDFSQSNKLNKGKNYQTWVFFGKKVSYRCGNKTRKHIAREKKIWS